MLGQPAIGVLLTLQPLETIGVAIVIVLVGYVSYMAYFHPLSRYPGPKIAALTNLRKAFYVYKLVLHEKLVGLHEQYGPAVRVGPNHLHFWDGEAIAPIYKGGRKMGKTEFYDAFTAFNPNLFGGTDEDVRLIFSFIYNKTHLTREIDSFSSSTAIIPRILTSISRELRASD